MNKVKADTVYHEEESLLMVRQWKEQIYQKTKNLSSAERIAIMQERVADLKAKYNLKLSSLSATSQP